MSSLTTYFTVLPKHCNHHLPMIFGGEFMAQMDIAAAMLVSKVLLDSECDSAVTHKFEGEFLKAAQMGDIIRLECTLIELRKKAIVVQVEAMRRKRLEKEEDLVAKAKFVFVSKKNGEYAHHGLEMK